MRTAIVVLIAVLIGSARVPAAHAQHLWWNTEKQHEATCLYGEITVLATHPGIYYCGANWHPGEPAGGYCGIQHNSPKRRSTVFSIWDTTAELRPKITEADAKAHLSRFGGAGTGAHTDMDWNWQVGETFQFFVRKQPASTADTTDTRYYIFDRGPQKWRHVATISNPIGGKKSVATIGGGLNSFLENFTGQDRKAAKLATYRLWLGPSIEKLQCLTQAEGDGTWGRLHDAYFLAEGDQAELDKVFGELKKVYGVPAYGGRGEKLAPISDKRLPEKLAQELKSLPRATKAESK